MSHLKQNNLYRYLASCSDTGIIFISKDGFITDCNETIAPLLGYTPVELIGQKITRLLPIPPFSIPITDSMTIPALELKKADQQRVVVKLTLTYIQEEETGIIQLTDITRYAEDRDQLIRAEELAYQAEQTKNQFIANMNHELRTPLNGILGFSDMLLDLEEDEQKRHFLSTIYRSGEQLLHLINNLLNLSSMKAEGLSVKTIPFNPDQLIEITIQQYFKKIQEQGLEIDFRRSGVIPDHIAGDPEKVQQIIASILNNAIKFTATGSITISREIIEERHQPATLSISIQDTGIGIDPSKLETIFQPFTQVDGSFTRKHGGVGMGLSLAKKLITLLNGTINVASSPGRGTCFTVRFPVQILTPVIPKPAPQSIYILIAEDNLTSQLLIENLMRQKGWRYDIVSTGPEVLRSIQKNRYTLILMDIQMPLMDGFEATRQIRHHQDELIREIPIIALTAHAMKGDQERCLAAGMDHYIPKPVKKEELYMVIDQCLAKKAK